MSGNFAIKSYPSLTAVCHRAVLNPPSGLDTDSIAEALGYRSYNTMMSELSRQRGHKFGADNVLGAMDVTGSDAPLEFMARQRGGVFVRLPRGTVDHTPTQEQCLRTIKEFSTMMENYAKAMLDGTITQAEVEEFDAKADSTMGAIYVLKMKVREEARREP